MKQRENTIQTMAYNIRVEVVSSRLMMMSLWLELSRGRFAGDDDGDDVVVARVVT